MVDLPEERLPTIEAIYNNYVKSAHDFRRNHLGASLIGNECERALFYTFRWCGDPKFIGRMHRLFATGYNQESRLISDLKGAGFEVYDREPGTDKQIRYDDFGGHFAGSLDAIAIGFPEAQKTWHVVECKSMNTKTFKRLKINGVYKTKYDHYCQMTMYMGWSGLERAFYFVVCKETDELYSERVYFDKEAFNRLRLKAERVIFADTPSFKISDSSDDFRCRYCQHKEVCHERKLPEINCRTCAMVTPEQNGTWTCSRDGHLLCSAEQREVHKCHVFNPGFVPLECTDSDSEAGTISYGQIVNGPGAIASGELQEYINNVV